MSESLDELLRRVDRALGDHAQADRITDSVQRLTSLEKEISPYVEDLSEVAAAFGALDQVRKSAERPETHTIAAVCREAAELMRQNKSGPQDLPRTLRNVNQVVKEATAAAQGAWREFIDASMPGLDGLNDLADMLGQMGADRLQVASLRRSVTGLRTLSQRLPDETAPGRAATAITDIHSALTALLGDSHADNDEVRLFVEKVARGGAHLRMLTPAVKDWMRRSDVMSSFKIVAGRPASE